MSDTTHEVEVQFTAKDRTSAVIGKINKAAGVLSSRVDGITSKVAQFAGTFGGLGAVFGFGASIAGANRYLSTIEDIATITGQSANSVAGMTHAMEQSGIAGEETRAIMLSISRKQAEIAKGGGEMAKQAKRYGVELKKGPEEALVSMAKAMEGGKMQTGDVIMLLEEAGAKAVDLLRKGPVEVQRLFNEGAKKNSHINDTTIAQYKQMTVQMTKVKQAWTRITTKIMIKLAPALTKLMAFVEQRIDGWADSANKFGDFLIAHMDSAITSARVFGKIMLANYVMMKLTGEGLLSNAGKMMKYAKGSKAGAAATASGGGAGAVADVAAAAIPGRRVSGRRPPKVKTPKSVKAFGKIFKRMPKVGLNLLLIFKKIGGVGGKLGRIFKKVGGVAFKIGRVFAKLAAGASQLGRIAMMLMKLSVIGAVITAVVSGIKQILSNVDGVRDRIGAMLGSIWGDIKSIGETIAPIFGPGSALRNFFDYLGKGFIAVLEGILWLIKKITHGAAVAAVVITERVGITTAENLLNLRADKKRYAARTEGLILEDKLRHVYQKGTKVTLKHIEMVKSMHQAYAEAGKAMPDTLKKLFGEHFKIATPSTPGDRPQNNFDFRGSRFDIMQNFAEGFDPDRIAVAFSNDLGALGERRLQSGLAPAFSAR